MSSQRLDQLRSSLAHLGDQSEPFGSLVLASGEIALGQADLPDPATVAESCIKKGLALGDLKRALGWMQRLPPSKNLARFELELADKGLLNEKFSSTEQHAAILERTKAAALAATGQTKSATELFEELITRWPADISIRRSMAQSLGGRNGDPEKALKQWRWIASRSRTRSESWFEAKYESARILVSLGKKQDAQKLLRFIQAVPPGWQKSKYRVRFDKLLLESR